MLAAFATWAVLGGDARSDAKLAATYPAEAASVGQALIVEVLITFVLVSIIMSVATGERAEGGATAPLAVGFALAVGVFIGVGIRSLSQPRLPKVRQRPPFAATGVPF